MSSTDNFILEMDGEGLTDMASLFAAACKRYASRPAYQIDNKWITYAECSERVNAIAASLLGLLGEHTQTAGTQAVIAVLLPNDPAVLELFYVAALTQSIVIPINHRLPSVEI